MTSCHPCHRGSSDPCGERSRSRTWWLGPIDLVDHQDEGRGNLCTTSIGRTHARPGICVYLHLHTPPQDVWRPERRLRIRRNHPRASGETFMHISANELRRIPLPRTWAHKEQRCVKLRSKGLDPWGLSPERVRIRPYRVLRAQKWSEMCRTARTKGSAALLLSVLVVQASLRGDHAS